MTAEDVMAVVTEDNITAVQEMGVNPAAADREKAAVLADLDAGVDPDEVFKDYQQGAYAPQRF